MNDSLNETPEKLTFEQFLNDLKAKIVANDQDIALYIFENRKIINEKHQEQFELFKKIAFKFRTILSLIALLHSTDILKKFTEIPKIIREIKNFDNNPELVRLIHESRYGSYLPLPYCEPPSEQVSNFQERILTTLGSESEPQS
jgi:hypothetical protein